MDATEQRIRAALHSFDEIRRRLEALVCECGHRLPLHTTDERGCISLLKPTLEFCVCTGFHPEHPEVVAKFLDRLGL